VGRTEPKVKASALAATLTPALLWALHTYVPGAATLPVEVQATVGVLVTGGLTWLSGYLTRTVDRTDVFPHDPKQLDPADAVWVDAVTDRLLDRLVDAGVLPDAPVRAGGLPPVPAAD
jgi:hypothetical protein